MTAHVFYRTLLTAFCLASLFACKSLETNLQDNEVDYLPTARQNFEAGQESFDDGKYDDAELFFAYVKNKFPYSKYASLSELRMADAHFEQENWLEAADAYRLFIRFHPRHEKIAFASFRIALAFWRETAGTKNDMFPVLDTVENLLSPYPPVHQRDLSATKDAIASFDQYILRHPDDENIKEAQELRLAARTILAEHEMYAADFYIKRKHWRGAMWRYQNIADAYRDTPQAPAAMLRGGQIAEDQLNDLEGATQFFALLVQEHPDSEEAVTAREKLSQLQKEAAAKASAEPKENAESDPSSRGDAPADNSKDAQGATSDSPK